jgi:hypothetical protein
MSKFILEISSVLDRFEGLSEPRRAQEAGMKTESDARGQQAATRYPQTNSGRASLN